jgi:hypothetical protein
MSSDVHTGPLAQAAPTDEHHPGPLTPVARPQRFRRSEREKRWERRRKRRVFEEVVGWIVVPVVLISGFWAVKAGLAAFGTTPTALIEGLKTIAASRS